MLPAPSSDAELFRRGNSPVCSSSALSSLALASCFSLSLRVLKSYCYFYAHSYAITGRNRHICDVDLSIQVGSLSHTHAPVPKAVSRFVSNYTHSRTRTSATNYARAPNSLLRSLAF
eukprot:2211034-Pleurochrysis_carterae.AAC.2